VPAEFQAARVIPSVRDYLGTHSVIIDTAVDPTLLLVVGVDEVIAGRKTEALVIDVARIDIAIIHLRLPKGILAVSLDVLHKPPIVSYEHTKIAVIVAEKSEGPDRPAVLSDGYDISIDRCHY
jgi:hypothetical protein